MFSLTIMLYLFAMMNIQNLAALREHAATAVPMLKLLSNEDRLLLLCSMIECERSVGDLETMTGISQPTLSQQLGILRKSEVVSTRRDGKFIYYRLADERALQLMQTIHALYCPAPTSN